MKNLIPFGRDFPRLIDKDFWEGWPAWEDFGQAFPSIDIENKEAALIVKADLPNVDPKDVNVYLEGNTLIIEGKTESEKEEKKKHYYRKERKSGSFYRSLSLPCAVIGEGIKAKTKNGVLEISLPKKEKDKSHKKIEIQVEK